MNVIKNGILCISLLRKNLFIASFPGKIVFGEIDNYEFIEGKHFKLHRCNYLKFYEVILVIIENICLDNPKEIKGTLIEKYFYKTQKDYVEFLNAEYKSDFNLTEINNLMDCFKELLLTSLLLSPQHVKIFKDLSLLDINKLKELQDPDKMLVYLSKTVPDEHYIYGSVTLNLDLILLLHKLNKLVSLEYRKNYMKTFFK